MLMLCGILSPVVYVMTVALGGFLRPDYSHKSQFISELIIIDAPNKNMLDALFVLHNLLTIAFGVGLTSSMQEPTLNTSTTLYSSTNKKRGKWSGLTLIVLGIFGFVKIFFPQDSIGSSVTITGATHKILAILSSLASILSMVWVGLWFQEQPTYGAYSRYTFLSLAFVLISGGLEVVTVNRLPFSGFMERITIGGFLQWLFVVGLKLFRCTKSAT